MAFGKVLFLFLLLLRIYTVAAQKLIFQQLGVRQGLPASEVYHLYQDKKGYIWAFTEYGIARHDGTCFLPVCKNLPFDASVIYCVSESSNGELYIANSQAQIYRIIGNKAELISGMKQVSTEILADNQIILDMLVDDSSNIWFSTHTKSYKHSLVTGKTQQLCASSTENVTTFRDVGNSCVVLKCMPRKTPDKCRVFIKDIFDCTIFEQLLPYFIECRNVVIRKGNRHYIMLAKEVLLVQSGKVSRQVGFPYRTLNMRLAPDGHIWLTTAYGGIYELDEELNTVAHYLDNITISDILFDEQNGIWISTIGRGVFYCGNSQRISCNEYPELSAGISLLRKVNGRLFIGTSMGDLFVIDKQNNWRKISLQGNRCLAINDVLFHEDSYYIGTKSALFKANVTLTKIIRMPDKNLSAYALSTGKNGELLIVSASRICRQKAGTDNTETLVMGHKSRLISVRSDGTIFIGSATGLYTLNQSLVRPKYLELLTGKNLSHVRSGPAQTTWICTKGNGLFCLTANDRLHHYRNTPSEVITDILFLSPTHVILTTNRGTFMGQLENGYFKNKIRLNDEETTCLEQDGDRLYLGTKLGLTILDVKHLPETPVYPFYLKSVTSEGQSVNFSNLTYKQKNLVFSFDLLAYGLNEKRLFYELEGPTPGKGIVNGTQLQLQNLTPGRYLLRVYPTNYFLNNKQKGWVHSFYIAPAFWQTRTFAGIVIFLSVMLITGAAWLIFSRISRKAKERSRIIKLLAGYRLTALKAQINPHFISNSLSAIQQLVLVNETYKASQYLAKFSLLIRYLLDYSDQSVASLSNEIRIIDLIIELEQLRFDHKFVFRKEISATISIDEVFIPPLITQPFIENAIWHGLLPLNGEREPELIFRVEEENDCLVISIIDNGIGRSSPVENPIAGHDSKGTGLILGRIDNLNRLHSASDARIELIDREDMHGRRIGLLVRIIFPLEMLNTLYNEQDQEYYY